MAFTFTGNSITIAPTGTYTTNVTNTLFYTDLMGRPYGLPVQAVPNAVIPEAPETWLRRRVAEVCELVAA